jgi:CPA2 family monovalent cation:H+ antiporter-2
MSSTAMVVKLLAEKRELETEHGRRVFSVLLFQDLAVIPLLIVIPALGRRRRLLDDEPRQAILLAVALLVVLLRFGPRVMKRWFNLVARQRSHELFTLNVLLATLLFAWLSKKAGLSMELGAFVAGMLIAETEFRFQVEEDIKPFRDVLLGLFFVAIGTQLNLRVVIDAWPRVILLACLPILLKFVVVGLVVRGFGGSTGVAVRTAVWLAQAGEFGFVLLALGGIGRADGRSHAAAGAGRDAAVDAGQPAADRTGQPDRPAVSGQEWLQRSLQLQTIASRSLARDRHVIICGYGRCGQALAHVLESEKVSFMALDLDPDRVRQAAATGESVVYGDSARRETLLAAGCTARARWPSPSTTPRWPCASCTCPREMAPQLPILVRTSHEADIERLRAAAPPRSCPRSSKAA